MLPSEEGHRRRIEERGIGIAGRDKEQETAKMSNRIYSQDLRNYGHRSPEDEEKPEEV